MQKKFYMGIKFKITLVSTCFLLTNCFNSTLNFDSDFMINIPNCNLIDDGQNILPNTHQSEIYVIGHAYGKPGYGDFFPDRLTNFIKSNLDKSKKNYIALTGDFVRKPTLTNYKKVKSYIDNNFEGYFISIGNHEISNGDQTTGEGLENYFEFFDSDIFISEFNNFLLISANFSNNDWLPSLDQKNKINRAINDTDKKYIIILSHQLFWILDADLQIKPNSDQLLIPRDYNQSLYLNSLNWIEKSNEKYFIIISGDYGAWGDKTYCKNLDNKLFIANGIGDTDNDTIIKLTDASTYFLLEESQLSTKK